MMSFVQYLFSHYLSLSIYVTWLQLSEKSYNLCRCWSVLWCKTSICCHIVTRFDIRLKDRINKEYLIISYGIVSCSSCQGLSLGCMAGDRPVRVHCRLGSGEYRRLWPRKHFTAHLSRLGRWRGHSRVREEHRYPIMCFTSPQYVDKALAAFSSHRLRPLTCFQSHFRSKTNYAEGHVPSASWL